ncbi:putative Chaperone J-domain superfamily [Helianthus anomalus]
MDESWRMRMGATATAAAAKQPNNLPPRRSPENTNRNNIGYGYETLDPEDFDDVFGGPPRSVLARQFSGDGSFARPTSLVFEDIFRKPNRCTDRTLPEFRIPESKSGGRLNEEEFYSDIFGNSRMSRSRSISQTNSNSKSKSNSSSILSSEELSPFRPAVVDSDDVVFSSFAAKLRPINVSSKWNTSKKMHEVQQMADSPCNFESFESDYLHKFKGCYSSFSQRVSSPEVTTFRPNSYASVKESREDLQVNSPASIVSSLNQDETSTLHEEEEEEDDDDEVMSSYVIEINPSKSKEKVGESHGVDEAIAWAKQKCKARNLEDCNDREDDGHECPAVEEMAGVKNVPEVQIGRHGSRESSSPDKQKVWTTEEPLQEPEKDANPSKQMELELLDEDIKLWSDGKEQNIRLLLSTLHHILWPSSGWIMIPLTNLKDSTNVKKAYQKARLCLHPDKLQQRCATIPQKYVAEKAFPILQDAWAAFISQDVCSSIK